jgi:hypothetical protein
MEPEIVCKPTAFKHGVTLDDIRWAFSTAKYDILWKALRKNVCLSVLI